MDSKNCSIAIVGSGVAGLYAALKLSKELNDQKILLITKSVLGESNSRYAQGGIVAVLKSNEDDSVESHVSDTLRAGAGLSDKEVVSEISEASDCVINDLLNMGVKFDRDENDNLVYTLEAAHSVRRILHSGGDATGRKMTEDLVELVKSNDKIEVLEDTMVVELLVADNKCSGVIICDKENNYSIVKSNAVVLATGGIGQLYKNTTNPIIATGDGIALSYNAGAILQNMEFVQFHPTALAVNSENANFLISEAVRGEGAILVDDKGVPFMHKYHELKELAPRDIVTRAIFDEMKEQSLNEVFLDATVIEAKTLQKRFPIISAVCLKNNIDISKNVIPVHPAAHYFMGGVKANVSGETSVEGLYAIGEVSATGLHGANRLASNSLLECVVCAYKLTEKLKSLNIYHDEIDYTKFDECVNEYSKEIGFVEYDVTALKKELQEIMWQNVGIKRSEDTLINAKSLLDELKTKFTRKYKCLNFGEYEFKNMLLLSELIVNSALERKESRGGHYRTDYLDKNDEAVNICVQNNKGEMNFVR